MITRIISIFLTLAFFSTLEACSVCFSAKEGARYAYYGTTALLSLVPLFLLFFFIRWIYRRAKLIESEQDN
jgi:hypothetical protein